MATSRKRYDGEVAGHVSELTAVTQSYLSSTNANGMHVGIDMAPAPLL